jgi:hypothetical protein
MSALPSRLLLFLLDVVVDLPGTTAKHAVVLESASLALSGD